ncbi:MAG: hypothetical protein AAB676_05435, partial [Verrucomicrobiota bacterium]
MYGKSIWGIVLVVVLVLVLNVAFIFEDEENDENEQMFWNVRACAKCFMQFKRGPSNRRDAMDAERNEEEPNQI